MSKRGRDESSSSSEDDGGQSPPKRARGQDQSTPAVLNRLLAIAQARGAPSLGGTWQEGRRVIELDKAEEIRRRHREGEWADSNGLVMQGDQVAPDDDRGPNTPYGPRHTAVFIEQRKLVEGDSLMPLLEAIAGAIDVDVTAMFEDSAIQERQQQNAIITEWNRNEMRTLMTTAATKKDALDKIRDELYRQQQVIDGHVEMNATIKAFRDLSNVVFPNGQKQQDFQDVYHNEDESLRQGNYVLLRVLAEQRVFVNKLCNLVMNRADNADKVLLSERVLDSSLLENFRQWFIVPHDAHLIDHVVLKQPFLRCAEWSGKYNPNTGMSIRDMIAWIRLLDWYIWCRDEILVDFPNFKVDFHDPNGRRVNISTANLISHTTTAAMKNFTVGHTLMRQIQADVENFQIDAGIFSVLQYKQLARAANAFDDGESWYAFMEDTLKPLLSPTAYTTIKESFKQELTQLLLPFDTDGDLIMDDDWGDQNLAWEKLRQWKRPALPLLERVLAYLDLNHIPRAHIYGMVRDVVGFKLQAQPDKVFPVEQRITKAEVIKIIANTNPLYINRWYLDDRKMEVNIVQDRVTVIWILSYPETKALYNFIRLWRDFLDGSQTVLGLKVDGTQITVHHDQFKGLIEDGWYLTNLPEIILSVWDSDILNDANVRFPVHSIGGAYASGLRVNTQEDRMVRAHVKLHVPTDVFLALATTVIPRLLAPLQFVLLDTLVKEGIVSTSADIQWSALRDRHLDAVFPKEEDPMVRGPDLAFVRPQAATSAIWRTRDVVTVAVAGMTSESFNAKLETLGLVQDNYKGYLANATVGTILGHNHTWMMPAIILSAYASQRPYAEQEKLRETYNTLLATYNKLNEDYQRMTRGDPNPQMQAEKRRIRELVHQPDPAYMQLPMFTGQLPIKPKVAQAMSNTMLKVRKYCPGLRSLTLNDLAHTNPDAGLLVGFAEFLAAVYSGKRLIWPDRFKKDKEYTINWKIHKDTIEPLKLYKVEGSMLTHPTLPPYRWPLRWRPDPIALVQPRPVIAKTI